MILDIASPTRPQTACSDNSLIGLAAIGADIDISQGLWADCMNIDFSREGPLEEARTVKVTAKPTYSANPPVWKKVGTA